MIRVMTYNIRGGLGIDKRRSVARIADAIRSSGAEIVCLQEVHQRLPWSRLIDQPKWLGERLGTRFVFQRNLNFGAGGFGNAVLTKFDIVTTASHQLTSTGEQRGLLEVKINTPDGPLTVFCTHLGLDKDERIVQAGEIAEVVKATEGLKIVCGDLNEEVDQQAVKSLIASTGLADTANCGLPTFSSDDPTQRIDFILGDPTIGTASINVPNTMASDHLPVVVDLILPTTEEGSAMQNEQDRMVQD